MFRKLTNLINKPMIHLAAMRHSEFFIKLQKIQVKSEVSSKFFRKSPQAPHQTLQIHSCKSPIQPRPLHRSTIRMNKFSTHPLEKSQVHLVHPIWFWFKYGNLWNLLGGMACVRMGTVETVALRRECLGNLCGILVLVM
ncbi:hypothetical protein WR25_14341 [Diploscapter pachys]|uniref:Uncharacterized protein n=1 Tax=Diploscapter pachys TaxID=2018661 RepID=A0A2A2KHE0_9BILA|nr:hypothetical protein WR25_14341 [Diploscapter pachys]